MSPKKKRPEDQRPENPRTENPQPQAPVHADALLGPIVETLPAELGLPSLVGVATILDWGLSDLWHLPANQALRFFLAHGFQTHPHLKAQRYRLNLLSQDADRQGDTQGYLHLAQADAHVDALVADDDERAWSRWLIPMMQDQDGFREWMPELLLLLLRGRLARGEGDPVPLRRLLPAAEKLVRMLPRFLAHPPDKIPAHLFEEALRY